LTGLRTGQGAPYTPSVTVNPNFDGQQKSSLGPRHQHAVKVGGIAYEVGPEMQLSPHGDAAGAAAGQRRLLSMNQGQVQGQRRSMASGGGSAAGSSAAGSSLLGTSVLEAGGISINHSLDLGSSRDVGTSVEHQRQSITQAIGLLENSQLLQQDAVLRDIVQIIVNRLNVSPAKQHSPPQRVVVTSDNGTQVNSIETATQTEVPKFKEKRIRPLTKGKLGRVEGQSCSLSDSDVPSDQNETADSNGLGRRRNSLEDISLSTNSPRESCDGYSRDASEASGPASVSSMVQMSVASSTDASQTATLAHDPMTPMHASQFADHYGDNMEALEDDVQGIELWDGEKVGYGMDVGAHDLESPESRPVGGSKNRPLMSPLQALNVNLNHYIGTYQHELEGISELANSPDGHSLSPTEKQFLAMSPSPSIETLKELKRILDHHYTKLFHSGNLTAAHGINSPATAEMQRLSMESSLAAEDGQRVVDAETGRTPERPPNPDPTKWSPGAAGAIAKPQSAPRPVGTSGFEIPRNIRMGNSPPKHKNVKTPLTQVPTCVCVVCVHGRTSVACMCVCIGHYELALRVGPVILSSYFMYIRICMLMVECVVAVADCADSKPATCEATGLWHAGKPSLYSAVWLGFLGTHKLCSLVY